MRSNTDTPTDRPTDRRRHTHTRRGTTPSAGDDFFQQPRHGHGHGTSRRVTPRAFECAFELNFALHCIALHCFALH
jgi:hypothetical protein